MRLFISLDLDEEAQERLVQLQDRLAALACRANLSRRENLHLTLAFLGEVSSHRLPALYRAMDAVPMEPLTLTFRRVGSFRGGLWWAGAEESPRLMGLQRELTRQLAAQGFRLEERRFVPHITLAREVAVQGSLSGAALEFAPFSTQVQRMSLMQSERVRGVLTYTQLYSR